MAKPKSELSDLTTDASLALYILGDKVADKTGTAPAQGGQP